MARDPGWERLLKASVAGTGCRVSDALRTAAAGAGTARDVLALTKALLDSLSAPSWTEGDVRDLSQAFIACIHAMGAKDGGEKLR